MWVEKYALKNNSGISRESISNENNQSNQVDEISTGLIPQIMKSSNFSSSTSEFIQLNTYDNSRLSNSSEQNQTHPVIQQMGGWEAFDVPSNFCRIESSELFGSQTGSQQTAQQISHQTFESGIVESKNFVDFIQSKSIINAFNHSLFNGSDAPDILTISAMMPKFDETEMMTLKKAAIRKNLR